MEWRHGSESGHDSIGAVEVCATTARALLILCEVEVKTCLSVPILG